MDDATLIAALTEQAASSRATGTVLAAGLALSHYHDVRQAVRIMDIPNEAGDRYARVKARELYDLLRDSRQ